KHPAVAWTQVPVLRFQLTSTNSGNDSDFPKVTTARSLACGIPRRVSGPCSSRNQPGRRNSGRVGGYYLKSTRTGFISLGACARPDRADSPGQKRTKTIMTKRTFGAALLLLLPLVAAAQSGAPVLKDRNGNPISEPPTIASQPESASTVAASAATSAPAPSVTPSVAPNVVQEGSTMIVRLDDTLDTRKLQPGKHFKAKLAEDMVGPTGAGLVPRG